MIRSHSKERRVDSNIYRRSEHVDKENKRYRIAGEIFGVEKPKRLQGNRLLVGFANKDNYGPDNNWNSVETIDSTLSPTYYKNYKNA